MYVERAADDEMCIIIIFFFCHYSLYKCGFKAKRGNFPTQYNLKSLH